MTYNIKNWINEDDTVKDIDRIFSQLSLNDEDYLNDISYRIHINKALTELRFRLDTGVKAV